MLQSILKTFMTVSNMTDKINYIKQRFATCKEPLIFKFIVFDGKLWPDNLVGFG